MNRGRLIVSKYKIVVYGLLAILPGGIPLCFCIEWLDSKRCKDNEIKNL